MAVNRATEHSQGVWVKNSHPQLATLCIEPWGDEIALPAGASFLVLFEGPAGSFPALEWEEGRVTVYGWSGSKVSVHHEGNEIRSSDDIRVPKMPERQV